MSSGLLHVFVKLGNLHETSNYAFYWIHKSPKTPNDKNQALSQKFRQMINVK